MTEPDFDPERLQELEALIGSDVADVVGTLERELSRALAAMAIALTADDMPGVALAAHAARNSALMIDARPMLERLRAVEASARGGDARTTAEAHRRLLEHWPTLRIQLQRAAARRG